MTYSKASDPTARKFVILVCRSSKQHLAAALQLLREYYDAVGVTYRDTPDTINNIITDPQSGLWIANIDEALAGCVILRLLPGHPGAGECKRLYVRPEFRGRGVAHALLNAIEAFSREIYLDRLYLDSKDDLEAALALYKKRGYQPCSR